MKSQEEWVKAEIRKFAASSANTMKKWDNEPAWDEPLIGFSSGADPLYDFYKTDIGDFYLSPLELLSHEYPDRTFEEAKITVISWILTQTEATKRDLRGETHLPSERWARSRIYGEEFNDRLRQHMVSLLRNEGIGAVAPLLSPLYGMRVKHERYVFASSWSERHAAYAAGLGTFGLCDGLITLRGKAMRAGSVVADLHIEPTVRPYTNHHAYCLFYMKGTCGKCIDRCPVGAITREGHNKVTCSKYNNMTREYVRRHFGFEGYGCGFCQTGVPCESGIPVGLAAERAP